jgi:hypothetical protein
MYSMRANTKQQQYWCHVLRTNTRDRTEHKLQSPENDEMFKQYLDHASEHKRYIEKYANASPPNIGYERTQKA